MTGKAVGNVNIVVYVKETLTEAEKAQIKSIKLIDVIKQLGIPVGRPVAIDDHTVAIFETDNFVAATLRMTLLNWCSIESFAEQHPRLNPYLGTLAKGSN
jgi:hypothetical protein